MSSTSSGSEKGTAPVSDTPGSSRLLQRVDAIEHRLDDIQRQYSKRCIDFKGPALRRLPGETPFMMLRRIVQGYWGRTLHPLEVADCHFTSNERAQNPVFVAFFNDRKDESNFAWILTHKPQWNGREKVFASLHLHTQNDRNLVIAAKQMKLAGQIRLFTHVPSGRLSVTFSNGRTQVFGKAKDLEKLANEQASKGIKAIKAKKRKVPKKGN